MAQTVPSGDNTLLRETVAVRQIGWVERLLGPENYRILTGLLKTPASIGGFILIGIFILMAVFAPAIIPPVTPHDPYKMPRHGFSPNPRPGGTEWKKNVPDTPFWWKPIMGTDKMTHLL